MAKHKAAVQKAAFEAEQAASLELLFNRTRLKWTTLQVGLTPVKDEVDAFHVANADAVLEQIDDAIVTLAALKSARFSEAIR